MRKPALITLTALILLSATASAYGNLDEAEGAFERGDYESTFDTFRALAEEGDPAAQWRVGFIFEFRQEVDEAVKWYRRAAEGGYALGQVSLAFAYASGRIGTERSSEEAARWFARSIKGVRQLAEEGDGHAQFFLSTLYTIGHGVEQDRLQAHMWLYRAVLSGNPAAIVALRDMALTGQVDPGIAVAILRPLGERGVTAAQAALGDLYRETAGPPQDFTEAARWYEQAAEQGDVRAIMYVAAAYFDGRGVRADLERAAAWYRRAAETEAPEAQFMLGSLYAAHSDLYDPVEAAKWYRKAAKQGFARAQFSLGVLYSNGRGVPQSYAEAVEWYRKAADQGHLGAKQRVGAAYYSGLGVPQDYAQAHRWLGPPAQAGEPESQFLLGFMYFEGKGLPQDNVHGYKWVNLAAAQGLEEAREYRDSIAREMTREQIAEGQRVAREWWEAHHAENDD